MYTPFYQSNMAMQKLNRNIIYVELLDGNPSIRGHIEQALMSQRMRDSPIPGRIFDDIYGCSNVVLANKWTPAGWSLFGILYVSFCNSYHFVGTFDILP
jgi:hypothetical protein